MQERLRRGFDQAGFFSGEGSPRGRAPSLGGALYPASAGRRSDRRGRDRARSQVGRRRAAARRSRGYRLYGRGYREPFRPEDRVDGRRTDQDVGGFQDQRVGTGREFPQGAAYALRRRTRDSDQDRRPAAQHANARLDAASQTDEDHQRDDLSVRTAGLSSWRI